MSAHKLSALLVASTFLARGSAATCESLTGLSLPDTVITKAETVAPGAFAAPNLPPAQQVGFNLKTAVSR